MTISRTEVENRRLVIAALLAALVAGVILTGRSGISVFSQQSALTVDPSSGLGALVIFFVASIVGHTIASIFYPIVILLTVRRLTKNTIVVSSAIMYISSYLMTPVFTLSSGMSFGEIMSMAAFISPLEAVVEYLAAVTAIWIAYHGGYERVMTELSQRPFSAQTADRQIDLDRSLRRRRILAVGLAALVSVTGLVLLGAFHELVTTAETARSSADVSLGAWGIGIPLTQAPAMWLSQAAFLLALLLVTGPRITVQNVLKGVAVIFGVNVAMRILVEFILPVELTKSQLVPFEVTQPLPGFGGVVTLVVVAVAVWLAFHDGLDRLSS